MSLRDRGYAKYDGPRTSPAGRWAVVFRHAFARSAGSAGVIASLIITGIVVLVWAVLLFIKVRSGGAVGNPEGMAGAEAMTDPGQLVYLLLVKWYGVPIMAFLVALFGGGGVIADDARAGAYQFYFARPLTREQYLAGKLLAPIVLVALVSLAPALLLAVVRVALATGGAEIAHQLWLLPATLALGTIESLLLAVPAVALSSLARGRGYAQGAYAALFLLPFIVGEIFAALLRSPWPQLLSMPALLASLGAKLFGYEIPLDERPLPWLAAAAVVVALLVGSLSLLRARLAAVEVVAS